LANATTDNDAGWPDGRIKLFLTQHVLRFRREHPDLFQRGEYIYRCA